ncbi:MAG: hypothetical protein M1837_005045 [Sclerophora amabilis]|nr:MAG: hypothetical protein M1837_005045 [Sclerophora amabilis]
MPLPDALNTIFSATYSNVPVYEFNCNGNHVMRRRHDDFINATHILKVADLDKPARTRVLEREVQKGPHEKIQGGYGKYQGTWVPLPDGRLLAQKNRVLEKLRPIFDFVPGDQSPPLAPKHTTAASNKPKAPKAASVARRAPMAPPSQMSEEHFDNISCQLNDDDTPDNLTIASDPYEGEDMLQSSQYSTGSRKRKRTMDHSVTLSHFDEQHLAYADELLDYFMLSSSESPLANLTPPTPPDHFNVDRAIDEQGHTALHWAAAMGDMTVVRDLLDRRANPAARSNRGETPLMRAVLFTNNYEKQTMPKLIHRLLGTIRATDDFDSTVFHHVAATTSSRSKFTCARYYCDTIVNKLREDSSSTDIARILDAQDANGDTALIIAATHGARKCARALLGHGASSQIMNHSGDTAERLLVQLNSRKREQFPMASSSPFQPPSMDPIPVDPRLAQMQPNGHHLDATPVLSRSFTPAILEKSDRLAKAFEKELVEKDADWKEANCLRANMDQELASIREQTFDLLAVNPDDDDAKEQAEVKELAALERENQSRLERSQLHEISLLVQQEMSKIPASDLAPQESPGDEHVQQKLRLATSLFRAQQERRALVKEVTQNQSLAGLGGERQAQYKRLIGRCLGMDENGVEKLLPEICQELEAAQESDVVMQQTPV